MDDRLITDSEPVDMEIDAFPDGLTAGSTVLVASAADPTGYAVGLRALCHYGTVDDAAVVVTTTESADRTAETYDRLCSATERPSLGIVDTVSKQLSMSTLYCDPPVVYTPSPGDLERLVMALSEISGNSPPTSGNRHLVVRSLTPMVESTSVSRVCTVLDRITGLRSGAGLALLGLEYTAHDEETMAAVTRRVDGVLWVTRSADHLEFEYRPSRARLV